MKIELNGFACEVNIPVNFKKTIGFVGWKISAGERPDQGINGLANVRSNGRVYHRHPEIDDGAAFVILGRKNMDTALRRGNNGMKLLRQLFCILLVLLAFCNVHHRFGNAVLAQPADGDAQPLTGAFVKHLAGGRFACLPTVHFS